jgi:hypothetical protein
MLVLILLMLLGLQELVIVPAARRYRDGPIAPVHLN